ncbi:MAG: hypothetical protein MI723_16815 [Caulobacterales bacterium]|nr:hypothetical protein [Caulobacterales bacterium]
MTKIAGACRRGLDSYFAHCDEAAGRSDEARDDPYQSGLSACAAAAISFVFVTGCLAAAPL